LLGGIAMGLKKIVAFAVLAASTLTFSSAVFADDIKVEINGDEILFNDQNAVIVDGRTLVPLRGVFDSMGFSVTWDASTRTAKISNALKDITMTENIKRVVANTKTIDIDVAPQIINNRLMIPLRAIAESIDADVEWVASERKVSIFYSKADGIDESVDNLELDAQEYLKNLISLMEELRTAAEPLQDAVLTNVAYLGDYYASAVPVVTDEAYEALNEPLEKLRDLKAPDILYDVDSCVKEYVDFVNELITFSRQSNPRNIYDKQNDAFMQEISDYKTRLENLNSDFGNYLLKYFNDNKVYWEGIYGDNVIDLLIQ